MKKKLIIFDLDGVLFDTTGIVRDEMLRVYPTLTAEIMDEVLCGNFHEGMESFLANNKPIEQTKEEKQIRRQIYAEKKSRAPLFEGIKELLEKLHSAGYTIVINTSALERNCLPLLERSGVSQYFSMIASAEVSKSKVEKFTVIDKKFDVSKEATLFITDTVGDVREAEIAGIPTVAVTWGVHTKEYFLREKFPCLKGIVDSVKELEMFIDKFFRSA